MVVKKVSKRANVKMKKKFATLEYMSKAVSATVTVVL